MRFSNRIYAGRDLAVALQHLQGQDVVVCGLSRGGVPVGYEVALGLGAPLDVLVVHKLGFPGQPELAMGAVGEAGVRFVDDRMVARAGLSPAEVDDMAARAAADVERRAKAFRQARDRIGLAGRTAVIVDDGVATGSTARAACLLARAEGAARVVLAVPVAPSGWNAAMGTAADEYVAVLTPHAMVAVGYWYRDFSATTDAEVMGCLAASAARPATT